MTLTAAEPGLPLAPVKHAAIDAVFVSGPMTGIPQFNYPAFHTAAHALRGSGYRVFNPAENNLDTSALDGTVSPPEFDVRTAFADYSIFICTEADAVAVLAGWETSPDSRAEVSLALAIGLPILDASTGHRLDVRVTAQAQTAAPLAAVPALARGPVPESQVDREADDVDQAIARHPAGKAALAAGVAPISIEETPKRPDLSVVPVTVQPAPSSLVPSSTGEIRSVSATGGQKGVKEARFDLIPSGPLWELAVHFGRGNLKYPDEPGQPPNWKRGYEWSKSKAALERHLNLFWSGEDYDPEMGTKHLMAVIWHAIVLAWYMENRPEFDDRPILHETYIGAQPTPQYILDMVAARETAANAPPATPGAAAE